MTTGGQSDLGPELRQLAQAILDRLAPAVRSAAAMAADSLRGPGRCQQVWCPVCAVAALVSGEQHPMLGLISEHSVALMTMLRTLAADPQAAPKPEAPAEPAGDTAGAESEKAGAPMNNGNGRYQTIPIVVEPRAEGRSVQSPVD